MNDGKKLSTAEMVLGVGAVIALVAAFLPWFGSSFASQNGFTGWGLLAFLALIVIVAMAAMRMFAHEAMPALPLEDWLIYLILAIVGLVAVLLDFIGTPQTSANVLGVTYGWGVQAGWFIALVGWVVLVVAGYLKKSDPQPATQPLNMNTGSSAPRPTPPAAPPARTIWPAWS